MSEEGTPTCPHCNGTLEQIHLSPIHFAVGSNELKCKKCGRKWILKEKKE